MKCLIKFRKKGVGLQCKKHIIYYNVLHYKNCFQRTDKNISPRHEDLLKPTTKCDCHFRENYFLT